MPMPGTAPPAWNTGGANNTEPNAAKKILGWTVNETPPSSTFNWWQKLAYDWLLFLSGLYAEIITWTALHTFNVSPVVASGQDWSYAVAQTKRSHSPAHEWELSNLAFALADRSESVSDTSAAVGRLNTRVFVPEGATITAIDVLGNNGYAAAVDLTAFATLRAYAAGGYTNTAIELGGAGRLVNFGAFSGQVWGACTLAAGPHVVAADSYLQLSVTVPNNGGGSLMAVYAVRVTYTQTKVRPSV